MLSVPGPRDFIREKPEEDVAGQRENRIFNREFVIPLKLQRQRIAAEIQEGPSQ
jgi:hypothetical protein